MNSNFFNTLCENNITGYKLKELRRNAGLTQADLSRSCGVPQVDISKIEKGLFNPSISLLQKIANGINKKSLLVSGKTLCIGNCWHLI